MNYKFKHSLAIHICAFICWLVPNIIWASVEVDGIYYELNTSAKTAAVASNPEKYTGAVDIPSSFVYNGSTYNVKSIVSRAFLSCSELISIKIPSSVTTIGSSAFERCTGLTDLVIGSGVITIDYEAFKNCSNLKSLTLPSSLKTIENETFSGCSSLSEIIAKRTTPPTIVSTTFDGVDKTACIVYVPEGCQSTYANATNWKTFSEIVERTVVATGPCGGNLTYTLYSDMTLVISGTGGMWDPISYSIYYEYDYYNDVRSVRKVIIEDGVTHIGEEAFCVCNNLTSVSIPNSVTSIGKKAFQSCYGLNSVTIPSSLSIIEKEAFDDCLNLTSVYISDLTAWCNITFDYSDSNPISYAHHLYLNGVEIKDLVIPEDISSIKSYTFFGCTGLNSVEIPSSVMSIGEGAFARCSSMTSMTIPNSVTSIENYAFEDCTSLRSITVESKTPIFIDDGIFESVNKSTCTLYVPAGCKSAYENAEGWSEFQNIEESPVLVETLYYHLNISDRTAIVDGIADKGYSGPLTIPESINYDGNTYKVIEIGNNAFYCCTGLTSVDIPNSLKSINEWAFSGCTGLTSLSIPNGVLGIARHAFGNCTGLISLIIPRSVNGIGEMAFRECENLKSITVKNEIPINLLSRGQFRGVDKSTCILYVPKGSKPAYENDYDWTVFEHIVEVEFDTDISTLDNAIYVEQTEGRIGGTKDISVKMKNDFDVRGFQFSMELPEGTTIHSWTLSQDRMPAGTAMNKVFATEGIDENRINVVCALNDGEKTFTGNDGLIATVNVSFAEDMEEGTYPIYLTNNSISDATAEYQLELSDVKATLVLEDYVVGDTNGDGKVLVGDVIAILNYIVGSASNNFNAKAADVNGDGKILIGDVIAVLNIIVNQ